MSTFIIAVIAIILFVCIFMALRDFICWYFKINEINESLKKIAESLKK
jgi:hypothetical protein